MCVSDNVKIFLQQEPRRIDADKFFFLMMSFWQDYLS